MKKQLEKRLAELGKEMTAGQEQLQQLNEQRSVLEKTLLRISGAIQVLKEELGQIENEKQPEGVGTAN